MVATDEKKQTAPIEDEHIHELRRVVTHLVATSPMASEHDRRHLQARLHAITPEDERAAPPETSPVPQATGYVDLEALADMVAQRMLAAQQGTAPRKAVKTGD